MHLKHDNQRVASVIGQHNGYRYIYCPPRFKFRISMMLWQREEWKEQHIKLNLPQSSHL